MFQLGEEYIPEDSKQPSGTVREPEAENRQDANRAGGLDSQSVTPTAPAGVDKKILPMDLPMGTIQTFALKPESSAVTGVSGVFSTLASLHSNSLVTETAMASALDCSDRTIRAMANRGDLPPAIKVAGKACWFAGKVLEHFTKQAERAAQAQERKFAKFR